MKVFVVLCFIAVAAGAGLTPEQQQRIRTNYAACVESSGVDKDLVTKARNGEFSKDPKLAEFFFCMLRKVNFITEDGKLQIDVIKSKLPSDIKPEDAEKVFAACANVGGATPKEVAQNAYECYLKKTPVKIHLDNTA